MKMPQEAGNFPGQTLQTNEDYMTEYSGLRAGRTAPFTQVAEWVMVAPINGQAKALYTVLQGHVNTARNDGRAWPGMDNIAELLGYSRRQSVLPYLKELVALGAVEVVVEKTPKGRRNTYLVHATPPPGYQGLLTYADFYAAKQRDGALQRTMGSAPERTTGGALDRTRTIRTEPDEVEPYEGSPTGTCSRRSPASRPTAISKPKKPYAVLHGTDLHGRSEKQITQKVTAVWHSVVKAQGGEEPVSYGGGWREQRDRHPIGSQIKDFFEEHDVLDCSAEWLDGLLRNVRNHAVQWAQDHPQDTTEAAA